MIYFLCSLLHHLPVVPSGGQRPAPSDGDAGRERDRHLHHVTRSIRRNLERIIWYTSSNEWKGLSLSLHPTFILLAGLHIFTLALWKFNLSSSSCPSEPLEEIWIWLWDTHQDIKHGKTKVVTSDLSFILSNFLIIHKHL